jgi:hypothetical protein
MTEKTKAAKVTEKPIEQAEVTAKPRPAPKVPATKTKTDKPAKVTAKKSDAIEIQKKPAAPKVAKPEKNAKPIVQKMIRDSFTLPENDYAILGLLKSKCLESGVEIKKSELVRAGLLALSKMPVEILVRAVNEVERLKTGRPKG